jgi:hypothetical protein
VLKTLDSYIDVTATAGKFPASLRAPNSRARRFSRILALSVVGHIFFYAWLINLDMSSDRWRSDYSGAPTELVKITEIALSPDRPPLRAAPDPVEESDIDRMEYDPDRADDVHLRSRSQKLGGADGETASTRLPRETTRNRPPAESTAPPVKAERASPPAGAVISQLPAPRSAPPMPAAIQIPPAPSSAEPPPARAIARAETSSGTAELGFETIRAQYMAQVRAKIRKTNERIMPRKWIEDMLTSKVSADFDLSLGRGGRILSVRLARPSGYSQLDDIARQAIYMASPYEGYPQDAGETIIFTVTVYYHP